MYYSRNNFKPSLINKICLQKRLQKLQAKLYRKQFYMEQNYQEMNITIPTIIARNTNLHNVK